jgi:hypothetical protein
MSTARLCFRSPAKTWRGGVWQWKRREYHGAAHRNVRGDQVIMLGEQAPPGESVAVMAG